jgi:glucosamine--fructose-6-phosphate aminotransferase (isomerizing)
MSRPQLLENIISQPNSLLRVLAHQTGEGRKALLEAAALLRNARLVVISGMGASFFASIPLHYLLAQQGIHVVSVEAAELLHYQRQLCSGAVVLLVSRSGESVEIVRLLSEIQDLSRAVIGVTNDSQSTLARKATISLTIGSLSDEMVAVQSYVGTLLLLLLLGKAVAGEFEKVCSEAERLVGLVAPVTDANIERMPDWDTFFTGGPVHLLGRGFSYASVLEGALLFNEAAKAASVPLLAGSFRHGPVEQVDAAFRAVIFVPHGSTRELNLSLARDLVRFGGQVRLIGPSGGVELPSLIDIPPVPDEFAPLFEIIPLQCAAVRLAVTKGLVVGKFRYASLVTRDEAAFLPPS